MITKLKALRQKMNDRKHRSVAERRQWLSAVLRGYYAHFGITGNARDIACFEIRQPYRYGENYITGSISKHRDATARDNL